MKKASHSDLGGTSNLEEIYSILNTAVGAYHLYMQRTAMNNVVTNVLSPGHY